MPEEEVNEDDIHQNWASGRTFGPRPVTELKAVKEGPRVASIEEALRQQLVAVVAANRELKAAGEKSRGATTENKANDAKTKKLESQLKQAKRDIAALEEQLKGKGKDSEDDDELDFYKKITEKKDQQIAALKQKMESNEDLVQAKKDLEEMTGAKERMEARVVKLKEQKTKLKKAHAELKKENTKIKDQLQEAYELQEELEARAGGAGKGGSDTAVLKLEFEIKQLKKELDEAKEGGGAETAKLRDELAKERSKPKGGISKEEHQDLLEECEDLKSELARTKKALDTVATEVVELKQRGGGGGGGGSDSGTVKKLEAELEELRSVKKDQVGKIKQLERELEDLNKEAREKQREFKKQLENVSSGSSGGGDEKLRALVKEKDDMIEKLNDQIAEITELAGVDPEELKDAEGAKNAALAKVAALEKEVARLQKETGKAADRGAANASQELREVQERLDAASTKLRSREDELKKLRDELNEATDKELSLRDELRKLKSARSAEGGSGGGASAERLQTVEKDLTDAKAALETLKASERELKRRVLELDTEHGAVEREARRFEREASRSKERSEVLEKELEESEKARRDLDRENRRMKRELEDKEGK